MTRKEYNGWTNYETWLVKLWMDNESHTQDYWLEIAADHFKVDGENAVFSLAERLREEHEQAVEDSGVVASGWIADLINAALSEVDWMEIAKHLLEEAKENVEA